MTDSDVTPSMRMFKGLQKPLEFMGLQGRYIYWAAGAAGGGILGFMIGYCLSGFLAGLIVLAIIAVPLGVMILSRQKKGLHTKKTDKGVFVYALHKRL